MNLKRVILSKSSQRQKNIYAILFIRNSRAGTSAVMTIRSVAVCGAEGVGWKGARVHDLGRWKYDLPGESSVYRDEFFGQTFQTVHLKQVHGWYVILHVCKINFSVSVITTSWGFPNLSVVGILFRVRLSYAVSLVSTHKMPLNPTTPPPLPWWWQ